MSLVSLAIEKKTVTYFATFLLIAGGILSYFQLGQLEDPEFTVKTAAITTSYPGASPEEIEEGVVIKIEEELEGLDGVERVQRRGKGVDVRLPGRLQSRHQLAAETEDLSPASACLRRRPTSRCSACRSSSTKPSAEAVRRPQANNRL